MMWWHDLPPAVILIMGMFLGVLLHLAVELLIDVRDEKRERLIYDHKHDH